MERSSTTPGWGKPLPIENLMRSSSSRSKGTRRRRSASNNAFSSTRTREQRMPTMIGCVIIQGSVYLCDHNGQEATHAGSEEQVTGEDRRDAGEDGEEGRPGIFRR